MNLKLISPALALITLLAFSGCKSGEGNTDQAATGAKLAVAASAMSAAETIESTARFSQAGNMQAAFETLVPPKYAAWLRDEWAKKTREEPITDEKRAEFKENISMFTAPDAEKKMWASLEPELTKMQAEAAMQIPVMIAMGQGVLASMLQQQEDLTDTQKQQTIKSIDAVAKWAMTAKFTDPLLAQKAIKIICTTARELELESLDQVQALSLDESLVKGGTVFKGFKQLLDVYGFSLDTTLDSVKAKVISEQDDMAKVKVNYSLFDTPLEFETDMVKMDGRWYSQDSVNRLQKDIEKYELNQADEENVATKSIGSE